MNWRNTKPEEREVDYMIQGSSEPYNEAIKVLISCDRMWEGATSYERRSLNMAIVALEKMTELLVADEEGGDA